MIKAYDAGCRAARRFSILAVALAVAMAADARSLQAGSLINEIKLGLLAHDVPDLWSGFQLESDAPDVNVELVFAPIVAMTWGALHPALGASINTAGDTSHAYFDLRWQIEGPAGLFFAAGVGAAIHDGELDPIAADRKALGSRVLFHIPAEIGVRLDGGNSLSFYFEHTSNANLARFNEGMDRLGVRYGYRF